MNKRSSAQQQIVTPSKGSKDPSLISKLQEELNLNQSYLNLVLGLLIILVAGVLVFNYFKKTPSLGPAQQTSEESELVQTDVDPRNLPGKYIVKEGDTLFKIAERYYNDGFLYSKLAEANKLSDAGVITAGQVLEIPKLGVTEIQQASVVSTPTSRPEQNGTGGAINQTIWGEKITSDTYTVVEDDWLSKIAGRAYGDIMAFDKIAQANNISNPDVIYPGMVLKIPR